MNELMESSSDAFFIFMIGLIIGSFLNVVIYRLPIMLEQLWKEQARLILELSSEDKMKINLLMPPSHCPNCKHPIKFYENIPLISYLLLEGKCRYCGNKISIQYPLVEILTGGVFLILFYRMGLSFSFVGMLICSSFLITLTVIDLKTQLLPDVMTIPLIWLGLLFNSFFVYGISLDAAVIGASTSTSTGYLFFWFIAHLFKLITRKEGMGYGDFKLFAALGAWFGIGNLPILLLLSASIGLLLALLLKVKKGQAMPFGPALAISGLIMLIAYPEITYMMKNYYLIG